MKHLSAIIALTILLTLGLACSDSSDGKSTSSDTGNGVVAKDNSATGKDSSNAVSVEEITLKNADDDTVTGFKSTDTVQKIAVKFSETSPGKVRGVFTAIDAGGEKNFKILENEVELGTLMNTATFTAKLDKGFPAGSYKFDVYLNGKLMKTQNYKVQ